MALTGPGGIIFPILKNEVRAVRTALWFRPSAYCLMAAVVALGAALIYGFLPKDALAWLPEVDRATVEDLLRLMAGSMLTVATVTLSVLMLVLSLAVGQASPRAVPELMADRVTQNALGTFLATFVYALAALLLFGGNAVDDAGVTLTFVGALVLIASSLRYLVQWIHHVAETLKVNSMIHRIHRQALNVLEGYLESEPEERAEKNGTGARASGGETVIHPADSGYVQLIDSARLRDLAEEHKLEIRLNVQEGDFVHPRRPLMCATGDLSDDKLCTALRAAVVIGFERSHEGDPRLGFELLAEVACRALSPGINDPQSAVACIEHLGSLLAVAAERAPARYPPASTPDGRIALQRPGFDALLERAFRPVMRDGAACAEVLFAIVGVLKDVSEVAAGEYLKDIVAEAERAEAFGVARLELETDRDTLMALVDEIRQPAVRH